MTHCVSIHRSGDKENTPSNYLETGNGVPVAVIDSELHFFQVTITMDRIDFMESMGHYFRQWHCNILLTIVFLLLKFN